VNAPLAPTRVMEACALRAGRFGGKNQAVPADKRCVEDVMAEPRMRQWGLPEKVGSAIGAIVVACVVLMLAYSILRKYL
jgi:hypothetical protein